MVTTDNYFEISLEVSWEILIFADINYWNLIKDAGYEVKLVLIKKLSDSLRNAVTEKRSRRKTYTADDFAGMWSDEYFMDADEMNAAIRNGRHMHSKRENILAEL